MEILWAEPCQDLKNLTFVRGTRVAVVVCVGSNQLFLVSGHDLSTFDGFSTTQKAVIDSTWAHTYRR